jgi:hypothetical protein
MKTLTCTLIDSVQVCITNWLNFDSLTLAYACTSLLCTNINTKATDQDNVLQADSRSDSRSASDKINIFLGPLLTEARCWCYSEPVKSIPQFISLGCFNIAPSQIHFQRKKLYESHLQLRLAILTWICLTRGGYALHRSHRTLYVVRSYTNALHLTYSYK